MTGIVSSDNEDDDTESDVDTLVGEDDDYDDDNDDVYHDTSTEFGDGVKMYLQKNGRCFGLQKNGMVMTLTPRPRLVGIRGDGLYFRAGSSIYDDYGLILGSRSPFRNIPILGWIL